MNRLESNHCRCPCHCPSTQDSETAVDGWVSGGDPLCGRVRLLVFVVTAYACFNVNQRQAQRGLELRTRVRFHGLGTRTVSVTILTKRGETTEARRLLVCGVSPRQTERSTRKEACQGTPVEQATMSMAT